jgi:Transcriptional regulator
MATQTRKQTTERASKKAPAKDRQFVTALARGLQILGCFTAERPELSGSELSKMTGIPQPTVWRLCHTMLKVGTLVAVSGDKLRPSIAALQLGHSAVSGLSIIELARPHMQEIADEVGGACGLAVRNGLEMVFVERCESKNQLHMNLRSGSALPIATTAHGWAYLAGLAPHKRNEIMAQLDAEAPALWRPAREQCLQALQAYDEHGYVLNLAVFHPNYNTAAVPIIAPDGNVVYTLNCGASKESLPPATLRKKVGPRLISLANSLQHLFAIKK